MVKKNITIQTYENKNYKEIDLDIDDGDEDGIL